MSTNQSKFEAGIKFDGDKLRYDEINPAFLRILAEMVTKNPGLPLHLWPPEAIAGPSYVLRYGAVKYEERNWERGFALSRPYGALLRHMVDGWAHGEDYDLETGFAHVWQGLCSVMFIGALWMRGVGEDDRKIQPVGTPASDGGMNQYEAIGAILGCDRDEARRRVREAMNGGYNLYVGLGRLFDCSPEEAKKLLLDKVYGKKTMDVDDVADEIGDPSRFDERIAEIISRKAESLVIAPGPALVERVFVNDEELDPIQVWKRTGGKRPERRDDGVPTRSDRRWFTDAEIAITDAMSMVEKSGGSEAYTDAITLLSKARDRAADHAEGKTSTVAAKDEIVEMDVYSAAAYVLGITRSEAKKHLIECAYGSATSDLRHLGEDAGQPHYDVFCAYSRWQMLAGKHLHPIMGRKSAKNILVEGWRQYKPIWGKMRRMRGVGMKNPPGWFGDLLRRAQAEDRERNRAGTPEDGGHHDGPREEMVRPVSSQFTELCDTQELSVKMKGVIERPYGDWSLPGATELPRADALGHRTRYSDSSVYDEICVLCGCTDGAGNTGLKEPCPNLCPDELSMHGTQGIHGPSSNPGITGSNGEGTGHVLRLKPSQNGSGTYLCCTLCGGTAGVGDTSLLRQCPGP